MDSEAAEVRPPARTRVGAQALGRETSAIRFRDDDAPARERALKTRAGLTAWGLDTSIIRWPLPNR
jgi:hypothetical protein